MDISNIDINYIDLFDLSYTVAQDVFEINPIEASEKKQKEIRKWIVKTYIKGETFPKDVMKYISKNVSDTIFLEFLKACHDYIQQNESYKTQKFDQISANLPENVRNTIWNLLDNNNFNGNISQNSNDTLIEIESTPSYDFTLILNNAVGVPEGDFDYITFNNGTFEKRNDEYLLSGEVEDFEKDTVHPFTIRFSNAKVEVSIYRADTQTYAGTPWLHLQTIATEILDKYLLSCDYLNDKEKEILPLIAEISKLSYWAIIPKEFVNTGFPILKEHLKKFGHDEIITLFNKLEKEFHNNKIKEKLTNKIIVELNQQCYEPLWRELFSKLSKTQQDYPTKVSVCYSADKLKETRAKIQDLMESFGYKGTYPDFKKTGKIKGLHLINSYDVSYFVGMNKNAVFHIHCNEEFFNQHLMIEFICGTAILKGNETVEDIYSFLFNANDKRIFNKVTFEQDYINENNETVSDNLEQRVTIATKKAELKKLTKKEKTEDLGFNVKYFKIFMFAFLLMGGLFSVFLTLGLILIGVLITLIILQPHLIPAVILEVPWWICLILSWVLFGAIMGIVAIFSIKK